MRLFRTSTVLAAILPATLMAQSGLPDLLTRTADYLAGYEKAFSVVVAEETYAQELVIEPRTTTRPTSRDETVRRERTTRADVLQTSVGQREWVAFRDVYEVDGQTVRDRDARLQKLFLEAPKDALDQARRILAESARFNLGSLRRDINVPTMALLFLRESNQARSEFRLEGRADIGGVPATTIGFTERSRPTIIRSADGDVPAHGRFWVDPSTGRVLKTELSVADRRSSAKITVTYAAVPKLTVWAPVLMIEEYTGPEMIRGKASYTNFRQFQVSVDVK